MDLTELVRDAIEDRTRVTFGSGRSHDIMVTCPGNGSPHYQIFEIAEPDR